MIRTRGLLVAIGCLALFAGGFDTGALAGEKDCKIEGVSSLAFGNYDPMTNTPVDAHGYLTYRCGRLVPSGARGLIVQISVSTGSAGTFDRRMQGGRDVLRYNVYLDAARNVIWGDGTGGTQVYSERGQPNDHPVTVPMYGRLFGGQDVEASTYLDQLIVTLQF